MKLHPRHAPRSASLLVGFLVCLLPLSTVGGATTFQMEIANPNTSSSAFMEAFDAQANPVADFDGDGRAEIVAHNDNQRVYVLGTGEPRVLAVILPPYPSGWAARPVSDTAVADVDGDGRLEVVLVTSAATTCVYEFNPGASTSTNFRFDQVWCHRADWYQGSNVAADGGPWVADVDGDGRAEIFMQTEERGLFAYNHDGTVRWSKDTFGGNAGPLVADLDHNGRDEALFFGDGGEVRVYDASSGSHHWTFFAQSHVWPASIPVAGNVGDVDGDGLHEVVFMARDAHDAENPDNNHFVLFVLNHDGSLLWRRQPSWGNPLSTTHPVLHDLTGDGRPEILAQDWNTMGHKPGSWQTTGPANVFAYTGDGDLLWRTELDNTWSNDDVLVVDADGDGSLEVLAIGYGPGGDGVWYLDVRTGTKETHVASGDWTALKGPTLADLNSDGTLEWALPVHTSDKGGGFRIYVTGASCHVAYGGWQTPTPCALVTGGGGGGGGDAPPQEGDFDATFTNARGNEWWVEVDVTANRQITGVDARVNDGVWQALELKDWGSWARSIHMEDGSLVQFRAFTGDGDTDVSGRYRWPDATPVSGDGGTGGGGGGGSGDFSATFSNVRGNEWWVETDVTANKALSGVSAQLNHDGTWRPLDLTDWGSWAKGLHAPEGTIVTFRAQSTDGDTAVSGDYRWTSATPVDGGDTGTSEPSSFSAEFHNVRGNEWWVETDVTANEPLADVSARVNGGPWTSLEKQDWGSWAKGMNAPEGSQVEFRATSTGGDVVTSQKYTWPPG